MFSRYDPSIIVVSWRYLISSAPTPPPLKSLEPSTSAVSTLLLQYISIYSSSRTISTPFATGPKTRRSFRCSTYLSCKPSTSPVLDNIQVGLSFNCSTKLFFKPKTCPFFDNIKDVVLFIASGEAKVATTTITMPAATTGPATTPPTTCPCFLAKVMSKPPLLPLGRNVAVIERRSKHPGNVMVEGHGEAFYKTAAMIRPNGERMQTPKLELLRAKARI